MKWHARTRAIKFKRKLAVPERAWSSLMLPEPSELVLIQTVGVCVDDGWFKQPHLAESDWTLGLCEAAHLCCVPIPVLP